jgi:predicted metal-dependent hydrolase
MASKEFILDDGISITVYKRRASRNLRLSINAQGKVRVTIPAWAPYKAGVDFARSRRRWIIEQQSVLEHLKHGQQIGKAHRLRLIAEADLQKPSSRVSGTEIIVKYPLGTQPENSQVQKLAKEAAVRALRHQAEALLPQRLAVLASKYGFTYGSISVKRLKGRWGSCDSNGNIVLNLYLMQLPWHLIDYVLLHELVHTRVLRHGPDFWLEMESILPNAKAVRKIMRSHQPVLRG